MGCKQTMVEQKVRLDDGKVLDVCLDIDTLQPREEQKNLYRKSHVVRKYKCLFHQSTILIVEEKLALHRRMDILIYQWYYHNFLVYPIS